jgi:hypothetical protein
VNNAEEMRNARIATMSDLTLLRLLTTDPGVADFEASAFNDMIRYVERVNSLSARQRAWAEEVARRVVPLDSREVPRGKEVETPAVLKHLPKTPPGRR